MRFLIALLIIGALVLTVSRADPPPPMTICPICHEPIRPGEFTAGIVMEDGTIRPCHFGHAVDDDNRRRYAELRKAK